MRMTVYRKTVEILICFYTVFEVRRWEKIQIEIKIDSSCKETKIIVLTDKITVFVNKKVLQKGVKKVSTFNTQ